MILHFNATGERRKELVKVIENSLGTEEILKRCRRMLGVE